MDIRNAKYNAAGTIDCEIGHPAFGWIPFTASPDDDTEYGPEIYGLALLGDVAPYVPPEEPQPTVADYTGAITSMLNAAAQARQYDNALSISTYVTSTNSVWAAEAAAFLAWRDAVWEYANAELAKVLGGLRPQPTVDDFLAELPTLTWP